MMDQRKVAVITGSATGLGKRIAIELANKGNHVVLNYRNSEEAAKQLAAHIEKNYGVKTLVIKGDVTSVRDCQYIAAKTFETFNRIDMLINNAGPFIHERKKMVEYDESEWNYILNGNLSSVFYLCKYVVPIMRKQKWGRIINFGFDRSESAPAWIYRSAFAAVKSGLTSLTKTLAVEEVANGITVNMVAPGDIRGSSKEKTIDEINADGNDRTGTGEDISRIVAFLCDEQSDYITGSVIAVTGGQDVLSKITHENM